MHDHSEPGPGLESESNPTEPWGVGGFDSGPNGGESKPPEPPGLGFWGFDSKVFSLGRAIFDSLSPSLPRVESQNQNLRPPRGVLVLTFDSRGVHP